MIDRKEIVAIIVTYGNRFQLLQKTTNRLRDFQVNTIIVDNNSTTEAKACIDNLQNENKSRIHVVHLNANKGAASGYKEGIIAAQHLSQYSFYWLMDDDLLPETEALSKLEIIWDQMAEENKNCKICLASNRKSGPGYEASVLYNEPKLILGGDNAFWGYDINILAIKILHKLNIIKRPINNLTFGQIEVYPYGGLFFHKELIETIGYPDTTFGLYVDDYEYTYRIKQNGGKLYLVLDSLISESEISWESHNWGPHFIRLALSRSPLRLYYTTRNMLFFQNKYRMRNILSFTFNVLLFSMLFSFISIISFHFTNLFTYWAALADGTFNKLGINSRFPLK